jgi:hypothetical protein
LFSGLEGESYDNNLTYTYTATFTSRCTRDWSEDEIITDPRGNSIQFNAAEIAAIKAVRLKPYFYGVNDSADGYLRVGSYPTTNFQAIFGI